MVVNIGVKYQGKVYSSPTIYLEVPMETLVVDSFEVRDVSIFDVPGAYLNIHMPNVKYFRLKLEGEFVDIVCDMNPYNTPNIRH